MHQASDQTFPTQGQYRDAVLFPNRYILDPLLREGTTVLISDDEPLRGSGAFAVVFVIDYAQNRYALRCWTATVQDAPHHYSSIRAYVSPLRLPYFVDFEYVTEGIHVPEKGKKYPTLRMEWVRGQSLRDFVSSSVESPQTCTKTLRAAADAFLQMCKTLHSHRIAHGDLQGGNVIVRRTSTGDPEFILIDYDTVFIPHFEGKQVSNTGVPGYQHPLRAQSQTVSAKDDYFAELVIYLTLLAVADDPRLWSEFGVPAGDEELIFQAADFSAKEPTPVFQRLSQLSPTVGWLAIVLWNFTCCSNIQELIPLEDVLKILEFPEPTPKKSKFEELLVQKGVESPAASTASSSRRWLAAWPAKPWTPPPIPKPGPPPYRGPPLPTKSGQEPPPVPTHAAKLTNQETSRGSRTFKDARKEIEKKREDEKKTKSLTVSKFFGTIGYIGFRIVVVITVFLIVGEIVHLIFSLL